MDSGKRTFSLCIKVPFFSFTIKSGDSAIDAMKAEHEASAAMAFAQGVSQIVGAMFHENNPKSRPSDDGGRGKVNGSRRSASA